MSSASKRDYYEILGVPHNVSERELKRAYRRLAMQFHPDRNASPDAAHRFKEAAEAYEVLNDPRKRLLYDEFGHDAVGRSGPRGFDAGFSSVEDIFAQFSDLFGDLFGDQSSQVGGQDLKIELSLSFQEAIFGAQRSVHFKRHASCEPCDGSGATPNTPTRTCPLCRGSGKIKHMQGLFSMTIPCHACSGQGKIIESPCQHCSGRGVTQVTREVQIRIPPGVTDGTKLRVRAEGELGSDGRSRGDLFVFLRVAPSPRFERDGVHLRCVERISFLQAALGCTLRVQTLDGETSVEIPAGVQHGDAITLRGQGAPHVHSRDVRGDLIIRVEIEIPRKLDTTQRALLEQLAAHSNIPVRATNGASRHDLPPSQEPAELSPRRD
jgi:molecular chaperone DnaJ